jgi:Flp pilus assembly protein TadB
MISSHIHAWFISIGVTVSLYFLSLSLIFHRIRSSRHLQERWLQFGKGAIEKWEKTSKKLDERRLQSLQTQNKLKNILAHPYPSLKKIEHLFYRSSFFSHIKAHITIQTIGIAITTQIIFIFSKLSLASSFMSGFFVSILIHYFFLRSKEAKWRKSFILIFPDALDLITRGLKSGMTLGRGIAIVSEESPDPVGSEFNYMASQLQLGINPNDVFVEAASRIGVDEFRFFSLALIIQREMGGSLADILGKLSEVIRERSRFRKKVMTLSAESKATAIIVGSLPVFLGIMVEFLNPGYIKFFFTDPKGKIMLWVCIGLSLTGTFVIKRLMRLES